MVGNVRRGPEPRGSLSRFLSTGSGPRLPKHLPSGLTPNSQQPARHPEPPGFWNRPTELQRAVTSLRRLPPDLQPLRIGRISQQKAPDSQPREAESQRTDPVSQPSTAVS